jgi:ParB/RepB/Spo0J family partition protein
MTAVLKLAKQHVVYAIPLGAIRPSPTNPRKTYNEQKLAELADSIKSNNGLIHPITVRAMAEQEYEIVVGERRWRATGLAGLETIDCKVVEMADAQVASLQIVENCQREDVDPLEEANGFRLLLDTHAFSVEDVMAKIGRSEHYVRRRLQLTTLPASAREALAQGEMVLGVAELVSLLPAEVQEKATADVRRSLEFSSAMTIAAARALLLERYTLALAKAPFDTGDAALVPEVGPQADRKPGRPIRQRRRRRRLHGPGLLWPEKGTLLETARGQGEGRRPRGADQEGVEPDLRLRHPQR